MAWQAYEKKQKLDGTTNCVNFNFECRGVNVNRGVYHHLPSF
jgi:hypothetical protein